MIENFRRELDLKAFRLTSLIPKAPDALNRKVGGA